MELELVHIGGSSPAIIAGQFCKIDRAILQNCTTENLRPSSTRVSEAFNFCIKLNAFFCAGGDCFAKVRGSLSFWQIYDALCYNSVYDAVRHEFWRCMEAVWTKTGKTGIHSTLW